MYCVFSVIVCLFLFFLVSFSTVPLIPYISFFSAFKNIFSLLNLFMPTVFAFFKNKKKNIAWFFKQNNWVSKSSFEAWLIIIKIYFWNLPGIGVFRGKNIYISFWELRLPELFDVILKFERKRLKISMHV